ncbi:hypothetical protein F0562_007527 [Nyssa sinensis]|uniref:Uncharacterized protein n=1 Tax=Nyssa sinensis TaxID=561372 RepID=A0A5J5A731_9ASTE|nr:hypothetical protein F0562_007527 [Nyssa sinensis]
MGEYQKEIQTLNYGENDDQEVVNLESSGMILDPSGDEPPILEDVGLSPAQPETESLENMVSPPSDIPHQSLTDDVPETHKR